MGNEISRGFTRHKKQGFSCKGKIEKEFANILRSLEQFIRTVVTTIFETECFLNLFWSFLRYNTLEQLEFKLEKIIGIINLQEKFEDYIENPTFFLHKS